MSHFLSRTMTKDPRVATSRRSCSISYCAVSASRYSPTSTNVHQQSAVGIVAVLSWSGVKPRM
jgi:hypothetical protein